MAGWINAQQKNTLYSEKKLSQVENRYGPKVALRLTRWQAFVNNNQDKTELEKLELTNDFLMNKFSGFPIKNYGNKKIIGQRHLKRS